jgi:hypothetical protein
MMTSWQFAAAGVALEGVATYLSAHGRDVAHWERLGFLLILIAFAKWLTGC